MDITVETNIRSTDYLDVVFDLEKGTYRPFRKPNDTPLYISVNSNHPPNIIKQLPNNIQGRLSTLSSNEKIFNEEKGIYQEALKRSGYNGRLQFVPPQQTQ